MTPEVEDAVPQGDGQPRAKRKLSRLACMTVSKPSVGGDQELPHKSSSGGAGFSSPAKVYRPSAVLENSLEDGSDDAAAKPDTSASPARDSQQQKHRHSSPPTTAATESADALASEPPVVTASAADLQLHSMPPEPATIAAADAPGSAVLAAVNKAHRVNLDDEEDDEWEDQPAPVIVTTGDAAEEFDAAEAEAAASKAEDAAVADYDPSSRRRTMYDDEDEWEELVINQKLKGTQQGSETQQHEAEEEAEQQGSASNSGSGDDILAGTEDETNAATQRLLRDSAVRDGLGKGFKPEVAPLNSLLGKLAARQAALEAKAKQRVPVVAQQQQPALTLEQLKAHLEQHSIGSRHQHKQPTTPRPAAADGGVAGITGDDQQQADEDMDCDIDLGDVSDDELMIEPAQPQAAVAVSIAAGAPGLMPPDAQQLLDELPPLQQQQPDATGIAVGSEVYAGTATELELQLGDDGEEGSTEQLAMEGSKGSQEDVSAQERSQEAGGTSGQEGEADGNSSGEDEEILDSSEIDGSDSESEEAESEQQHSEELAEPEPLHWEEEEEGTGAAPGSSSQQEAAADGGDGGDGGERVKGVKPKSSKEFKGIESRSRGAAGGFIEAEADLSDEEGAEDGESDYEGDEDDDEAILAELINEVKEGRMDESRRVDLHAKWVAGKDAKEMRDLLDALKRGFRRKRKAGAGLDSDEEDGTDAAARRRRAQLLGTLDDEDDDVDAADAVASDRLKRLDFQWQEEEQDMLEAAAALAAELSNREKQKKIQKLQLQASESQDGTDVMQLLQMDMIDEDSQHTAALLSKAASAPAAVPNTAEQGSRSVAAVVLAVGHSMPAQVRVLGSKLRQQTGPDRQAGSTTAAAGGSKVGGSAGSFTFQMFGKDLTNSSKQQGAKQQVAGSFIGRQASNASTVRAASNYGASRSFVFGSDPSNYSNPAAKEPAAAPGPSNFAGLSKLIGESRVEKGSATAAAGIHPSRLGQVGMAVGSQDSSLLSMLGTKKVFGGAAAGSSKLHMDAVGTKFKAAVDSRGVPTLLGQ